MAYLGEELALLGMLAFTLLAGVLAVVAGWHITNPDHGPIRERLPLSLALLAGAAGSGYVVYLLSLWLGHLMRYLHQS
jgi:uncharacterized membrane protein